MGIYLISAEDGRFIRQIVKGERSAEYEELHILKPVLTWSPDGKKIVFSSNRNNGGTRNTNVFIADWVE